MQIGKVNTATLKVFALVVAVGLIGVVLIGAVSSKLPQIDIDEIFKPFNPPTDSQTIDGHISYDIFLDYANGDRETYGKNIQVPELKFSLLSLMDGSQTRELRTITIRAQGELDLPSDTSRIGSIVTTTSAVEVFLGESKISTQTFTEQMTLQEIQGGGELYEIVLPVASLTLPSQSGSYPLSFKSNDKITFSIDGQARTIEMQTTPTVFMQGLQPLYVQANSATIGYVYSKTPNIDPRYGDTTSYNHYATVTARNFKPNTGLLFDYTQLDLSYIRPEFKASAIDKTIQSDASGTAIDKLLIADNKLSTPDCWTYHANLGVSDGTKSANIEIGCKR